METRPIPPTPLDVRHYNREAWNREVARANPWTVPVAPEVIAEAREGRWSVLLTETRPVPRSWFPPLRGLEVLCLAASGGQQAPIFAAAGARVTVLDNSPAQLAQDRLVAEREGLELRLCEGDMRDLSLFPGDSFDLVFHPVSNAFVPEIRPVWSEAHRVLRRGGSLLAGWVQPLLYLFDQQRADAGELVVRHRLPYSDLESLDAEERERYLQSGQPLEFGHTLTDQIGGQLDAGFVLAGFYEDTHAAHPISRHSSTYAATRAVKL